MIDLLFCFLPADKELVSGVGPLYGVQHLLMFSHTASGTRY